MLSLLPVGPPPRRTELAFSWQGFPLWWGESDTIPGIPAPTLWGAPGERFLSYGNAVFSWELSTSLSGGAEANIYRAPLQSVACEPAASCNARELYTHTQTHTEVIRSRIEKLNAVVDGSSRKAGGLLCFVLLCFRTSKQTVARVQRAARHGDEVVQEMVSSARRAHLHDSDVRLPLTFFRDGCQSAFGQALRRKCQLHYAGLKLAHHAFVPFETTSAQEIIRILAVDTTMWPANMTAG